MGKLSFKGRIEDLCSALWWQRLGGFGGLDFAFFAPRANPNEVSLVTEGCKFEHPKMLAGPSPAQVFGVHWVAVSGGGVSGDVGFGDPGKHFPNMFLAFLKLRF